MGKVVKGSSINYAGAIAAKILGFLYVWLLTRFLTADEVGIYYLGFSLVTFFSILGLGGMDQGMRRFIAISHANNDITALRSFVKTAFWAALPMSIAIALLFFIGAEHLSNDIFAKPRLILVLRGLSPYIPFFVLATLLLSFTQGLHYMQYRVYCFDIVNIVLKFLITLVFFLLGLRLSGVVTSVAVSIIFVSILAYHYFRRVFPCEKSDGKTTFRFRELFRFSLPQTFTALIQKLDNMTGTIMLGYFAMSYSVGIYSVCLRIILLGSGVIFSFNTMLAPTVATLHSNGQRKELERVYKNVTKWCITLGYPIFLVMIILQENFLIVFGEEYVGGATCLAILAAGQLFNSSTGPAGLIILMTGRSVLTMINTILTLSVSFSLSYLLVPKYHLVGAATAVACAMFFVNILRMILVYRLEGMHPYTLGILKPVLANAVAALVIYFLQRCGWEMSQVLSLGILISVFVLVYVIGLYLLGFDETDRYILSRIRNRSMKGVCLWRMSS